MDSPLREDVDDFLAFINLEKGLAENTISNYERDLETFSKFVLEKRKKSYWSDIDAPDVSDWIYSLSEANYSNASLCRKLSAVRVFVSYLLREDRIERSFMDLVSGPKLRRRSPEILTVEEIRKLLEAPRQETPQGLRDRAILELIYSSGLRISELCGLVLQQVDLEQQAMKVFGKGSKERVVPVGGKAARAIAVYLESGRPKLVRSSTGSSLFLSNRGQPISRKTVWHLTKKYAGLAGIEKPVKPHMLRHSFATHLLSGGADLRVIQELLGHADITTTQIYASIEADRMTTVHSEYHPRDKWS